MRKGLAGFGASFVVFVLAFVAAIGIYGGICGEGVRAEALEASGKTTEERTVIVRDIACYDIWKHINGLWQFGKKPGSAVSFSADIGIKGVVPEGGVITSVTGSFDNSFLEGAYALASVYDSNLEIKKCGEGRLAYDISTVLMADEPEDIRRVELSEYVEGYRYYMPAVFRITYVIEIEGEEPPEEEPEEPLPVKKDIDGQAILALPEKTYEGHSVYAEDYSLFTVDGVPYGAPRMYSEGLARNKFTASGEGTGVKKQGSTTAEICFPKKGSNTVTLTVTAESRAFTDRKEIDVLATPSLSVSLSGTQKENRRQNLIIRAAVNPDYPLEKLWVELEKKGGAERVRLNHDLEGGENVLSNSDLIKTRAIEDRGSSEKFVNLELPFLTKNSEETEMTYRVYAEDSRGRTDLAEGNFTVREDKPPAVVIHTEKSYLRDEGSNVARVLAEDGSALDGDRARRTWYVREEGHGSWSSARDMQNFKDASFGAMETVIYEKTGVGKVEFRLEVQEEWTEETLPEYVTQEDYLSGTAQGETEVINIAPVVSLDALKIPHMSLLMIADSKEREIALKEEKTALYGKLLEKGIKGDIQVQRLKGEFSPSGAPPDEGFILSRPYGYTYNETFLEKDWYLSDKENLYTVSAEWKQNTGVTYASYYNAGPPYSITAGDLVSGGAVKWSVTISEEEAGAADALDILGPAQDDGDKYIFFRGKDRTLIYKKENGAYLGTVNFIFGEDNYAEDSKIYTVKEDGVYQIDILSGKVKTIFRGNICVKDSYCDNSGYSKRLNNEIHFISVSRGKPLRGMLDPVTEKIRFTEMKPSKALYNSTYTVEGYGADGRVCLGQDGKSRAFVFGRNGEEIACFSGWKTDREHDILPVYRGDGTFEYIAALYNTYSKGSSKYRYGINVTLYSCQGREPLVYSQERTVGSYGTDGNGTQADRAMYAVQFGDNVIVNTGSWTSSISDGSPISNYYYETFSQLHFNTGERTVKRYMGGGSAYSGLNIAGSVCEYGKIKDNYVISAYSWGHAGNLYGESVNQQQLKVTRLPLSEDEALALLIGKYAPAAAFSHYDETAALVFGRTEPEGTGEESPEEILPKTAAAAELSGSNLIFPEEETDGTALASLITEGELKSGVMKVKAPEGGENKRAAAGKSYSLRPGTKYYYEFDYRTGETEENQGPKVSWNFERIRAEEALTAEGGRTDPSEEIGREKYIVLKTEKEEFFSPEEINPYFQIPLQRVEKGMFTGAELNKGDQDGKNRTMSDGGKITFTVPQGSLCILSFDYRMTSRNNAPDEVYAAINGERWHRNSGISPNSGAYTHPYFLPEGENTIEFTAKGYGLRPIQTYITIDNLKVTYLQKAEEEKGSDSQSSQIIHSLNGSAMGEASGGNSFQTLKGSFETPQETVSYWSQKAEFVDTAPAKGEYGYIVRNASNTARKNLTITVPEGKTAVNTAISIYSAPGYSGSNRNVKWGYRDKIWHCYGTPENGSYPLHIPNNFVIFPGNITGTHLITEEARNGNGDFSRVKMALVNRLLAPVSEGKYFLDPDSEKLYFQNETFQGETVLRIEGSESWDMKNFRLYYVEKGKKIYVEEGNFTRAELGSWAPEGGTLSFEIEEASQSAEETPSLIYGKGEMVKYNTSYFDYENDPSKREYWRYTHRAGSDGFHPQAAYVADSNGILSAGPGGVLAAPIDVFHIDGKYTVEHWQEDSTGRIEYDKLSNIAEMTFYIEGGEGGPWITHISTQPNKIEEGDSFRVKIGVDDLEKDSLSLTTEVFLDKKLIYTHSRENILPDSGGKYPYTYTDMLPQRATEGIYQVVCTVRDEEGAGMGTYSFEIEKGRGINGEVSHYPLWEEKRLNYNNLNPQSPRSENTFWPEEAFLLKARVIGEPVSVTVYAEEYSGKRVELTAKDGNEGQAAVYEGSFYDEQISIDLGKAGNSKLTFIFEAVYPGGVTKEDRVEVITDNTGGGIKIHRVM